MSQYQAPVRDMLFAINELADLEALRKLPGLEEVDAELVGAVLEEASRMAGEVLGPLNWSGDREGVKLADDNVTEAAGFRDAYQKFHEGGWPSLPFAVDHGGQGMPAVVSFAAEEMWQSSNLAFALCPMLTQAAVEALEVHGSGILKATYLEKLISGEWTGAMDLTEPQAGSDLAALRCKAEPQGDHFLLTGQKIFITWGDHGMADNIIHMVLARLPDAPDGVGGISLFLVPKFMLNADGSPGARNDMRPVALEHKLGIHASPTCVMSFGDNDGAVGYLVGEANAGLRCMFTMMNHARLNVGVQGLAIAERAYQKALSFAKERVQGRSPDQEGRVTIIHHPDVRRMLLLMKSQTEAMRALALTTAAQLDNARNAPDADLRAAAKARVDLLVPVVKGWCTEQGQEVTSLGVQIHGGMGFIEETGAAQHFRDSRIATIYEGTTGIQGQDLAGRKLIRDNGTAMRSLIADMRITLAELKTVGADLAAFQNAFATGIDALETATDWLLDNYAGDVHAPNSVGVSLLMLSGYVTGGWQLARAALAARRMLKADAPGKSFLEAKIVTANFYASQVLPRAQACRDAVLGGSKEIMALAEDQF